MVELLRALESWFGQNSFSSNSHYSNAPFRRNIDFNSLFYQKPLSPTEQMVSQLFERWNLLTDGQKLFIPILAANLIVFGLWQLQSWKPFMIKYFTSSPRSNLNPLQKFLTSILTSFSHFTPLHLLQNMYTLYNFMSVSVDAMSATQFLLLYLTAALVSNTASDLFKTIRGQENVLSVGASGSIMAVVAYVYSLLPDAASAIKTILYYQMAGLIAQTDNTDYAAHLGGALWGMLVLTGWAAAMMTTWAWPVYLSRLLQGAVTVINNISRNFRRKQNSSNDAIKDSITPFENTRYDSGPVNFANLWKPFGFTVAFSGASFAGAAIWQYENMRAHALEMRKNLNFNWLNKQVKRPQQHAGELRNEFNRWWNSLTEGQKLFVPICAANVAVFCAWRVRSLQPMLIRYFCSNPASKAQCWPMVLSTFSHYSAFHLMANMYVLHSFSTGAVSALGKEQFLALYLSAGVISSFTSYVYKVMVKQPGLSLGASGAIMAVLGFVCTQYPDTTLGIIFLPFLTFSAGSAIKAIVALDLTGAVLGWKLFDHAAHLGGALWGIAWAYWGNTYIWQNREPLLQYWHSIRSKGSVK
ncbi:presenilins-associated rhomboid-like protein, mitochondrial [Chrysoperla carnea]|uniref:presenilins-associated rhomboid-like protein, mitochondrial n=1 Tax=Chrysoperla carnea TaxID=189513 RepID=UPI001D095DCD|nr:presenilins-associated rhomboid-like protein, mitochondrial [Chrysoperla carnea]